MSTESSCDEDLVRRLPLPLARVYRRAHNQKDPLQRHHAAYLLWEASLKLLASAAIAVAAESDEASADLAERLEGLDRPSAGHWRGFVRILVPGLAARGDRGFAAVSALLEGPARDDLPRLAGLDAVLLESFGSRSGARALVKPGEVFDRLVHHRNRELGHGAPGQRRPADYDRLGRAILAGVGELLGRLDVLAGRRLVYVPEVSRLSGGGWQAERLELVGESPRLLAPRMFPDAPGTRLPLPDGVYLEDPDSEAPGRAPLVTLSPLVVYLAESDAVFLLNGRRGKSRCEYMAYTTGELVERDLALQPVRPLFARALGLDGATASAPSAPEHVTKPGPSPAPAPRVVGEYQLVSRLGQGGMGVVYRARQPVLGREVAVKVLLRPGDAQATARFTREIRSLGKVEHPHLVKIYTSGADGDQWFYVMELIPGATLAATVDLAQARGLTGQTIDLPSWRGLFDEACAAGLAAEEPFEGTPAVSARPAPTEPQAGRPSYETPDGRGYVWHVVRLVKQVAEAAGALHAAGVTHRDIKPANVTVRPGGSHEVLVDLGLAQLADEVEGRLTRTRQFVGTLRYASPEQILAADRVDHRSDVYSLGATLWELLSLRPIYGATEKTSTPELMRRIQFKDPEAVRTHNPCVPPALAAVVDHCLEKDPDRRYGSAAELADDLGRFLAGERVKARPVPAAARTLRRALRRPWLLGLVAANLGVLAALAAFLITLKTGLVGGTGPAEVPSPARVPSPAGETRSAGAPAPPAEGRSENRVSRTPEAPPQDGPAKREAGRRDEEIGKLLRDTGPSAKRVALLVGINDYQHRGLPSLRWAENDAVEVAVTLLRIGFDTVVVMKGSSVGELRPTRANILKRLKRLADGLDRSDVLLVFLSGHGAHAIDRGPDGSPSGKDFFCPIDAAPDEPDSLISLEDLTGRIRTHGGKNLLLVDASRDTPRGERNPSTRGLEGRTVSLPEDTAVLFSSRAGQRSSERDDLKHGVFTYSLLQSLLEAEQGSRPLTWNSLVQGTEDRMAGLVEADRQEPFAVGSVGRIVLGRGAEGASPGEERQDNALAMKFCWCPAGTFTMGSPPGEAARDEDERQTQVKLSRGFWLATYEVTQEEWTRVMGTTLVDQRRKATAVVVGEGARHPMYLVNHAEAELFCAKFTASERDAGRLPPGWEYRLPTEAQWEYACRAGGAGAYGPGDDPARLSDCAWFGENSRMSTHPVGGKAPNGFGLHDMLGNVWEWCLDGYTERLPGGQDSVGPSEPPARVVRGGSWHGVAAYCRPANRHSDAPDYRGNDLGFRVARVQTGSR
ncbi:MAG: SUMF1/EgtB/PvdO family nonheme iron enzyme [Isosphaeraceae bacterium]